MPFLPPNQQRQSTEGTDDELFSKLFFRKKNKCSDIAVSKSNETIYNIKMKLMNRFLIFFLVHRIKKKSDRGASQVAEIIRPGGPRPVHFLPHVGRTYLWHAYF